MRRAGVLLFAVLLAGCGSQPPPTPDVKTPQGFTGRFSFGYPKSAIQLSVPDGWNRLDGQTPLVASMTSGSATIAIWRYPRVEPLPTTHTALATAKAKLLAQTKAKDPTFSGRAKLLHVGPARAIEVRGRVRVAGLPREVRSTHVFAQGSEVVVDAYAQHRDFARVDRDVVRPMVASLRVGKAPGA